MSNNIEDIYQDLDFFSPNGLSNKLFFHYLREIMLISQDGKFLIKEAPYFHGLVVKDVFYNYFGNKEYYKNLSNIVQDNCSLDKIHLFIVFHLHAFDLRSYQLKNKRIT